MPLRVRASDSLSRLPIGTEVRIQLIGAEIRLSAPVQPGTYASTSWIGNFCTQTSPLLSDGDTASPLYIGTDLILQATSLQNGQESADKISRKESEVGLREV